MRIRGSGSVLLILLSLLIGAGPRPALSSAAERHAGTVLTVNASSGSLTLDEFWVGGQRRTLQVRLAPDTQVVRSERSETFTDWSNTFTTTRIDASELRAGDFVVVELAGAAPEDVARLVMVTHPARAGS